MAIEPRKSQPALNDLIAEIERSRVDFADGLRELKRGADIPARFSRSVARHPGIWATGLVAAGIIAALTASVAIRASSRRKAPGQHQGTGDPGLNDPFGQADKTSQERSAPLSPLIRKPAEICRLPFRVLRWAAASIRRSLLKAIVGSVARSLLKGVIGGRTGDGGAGKRLHPADLFQLVRSLLSRH